MTFKGQKGIIVAMIIRKPMLAATLENARGVKFPVEATPKLDGIRCLILGGKPVSRKFKDIPNRFIQAKLAGLPDGLDGELMVPGKTFHEIQSIVMREDGEPDFHYAIFDYVKDDLKKPYKDRIRDLLALSLPDFIYPLVPMTINNVEQLNAVEAQFLKSGHEGVMIRSASSPYKCGRATEREGFLSKIKQFRDSEAVVVGFEEQLENTNEATKDELGHTKRSSHQDNKIPKNTLGKFLVKEIGNVPWKDREFAIGTGIGLTQELRQEIWNNRDKYLGKIVTYKYQPHGVKELPRIPIWKGFRDSRDMS